MGTKAPRKLLRGFYCTVKKGVKIMAKKSAKRKPTKNQQEYAKQLSRIRKAISRLTKDGYRLQGNIIPETPKDAIRKRDIERLKKITPSTIREKGTAVRAFQKVSRNEKTSETAPEEAERGIQRTSFRCRYRRRQAERFIFKL